MLYRIYVASTGTMPRYVEFRRDLELKDVVLGSYEEEQQFRANLQRFLEDWVTRESFAKRFARLTNEEYANQLLQNDGIKMDSTERSALVGSLTETRESRADVLLKIAENPAFIEKEKYRSVVLLHYFGYLRRNPDDTPGHDFAGLDFWLQYLRPEKPTTALMKLISSRPMSRPKPSAICSVLKGDSTGGVDLSGAGISLSVDL